jgi:hypothetical protein
MLHSRTQAHVYHFRTNNYAIHKALQNYYESIVPLIDTYIEGYQGKYGIIGDYKTYKILENANKKEILNYFNSLLVLIGNTVVPDSYLKNVLDSITELIQKTIYLITNLN